MSSMQNFDPIRTIREMAETVYAGPIAGCDQQRFDTFTDQCAALRLILQSTEGMELCGVVHQMFTDLRDSGLTGAEETTRRVVILQQIANLSVVAERELNAGPASP